ncbi:MAG: hypothetical protein PHS14_09515 [Elusimicrobia bacterium]|nr:hypothetical protein [Elusimicrobiota bacterium]
MTFPDSEVIAAAESVRLEPVESEHDVDCPQHPYNDVLDEREDCECTDIRAGLAAAAVEARADLAREDAA